MGQRHHHPRAAAAVARDELRRGVIISTIRLPGPDAGFESMAFSPGWPATGDTLASARTGCLGDALAAHRVLVERFRSEEGPDTTDPNWVFLMLGLPPRR